MNYLSIVISILPFIYNSIIFSFYPSSSYHLLYRFCLLFCHSIYCTVYHSIKHSVLSVCLSIFLSIILFFYRSVILLFYNSIVLSLYLLYHSIILFYHCNFYPSMCLCLSGKRFSKLKKKKKKNIVLILLFKKRIVSCLLPSILPSISVQFDVITRF